MNGSTSTRWGALRAQPLAFVQRLVHQADVAVLQVAQAAVHELRALRRRAGGEVVALDQRGAQPTVAASRATPTPVMPPPIDQHVERVVTPAGRSIAARANGEAERIDDIARRARASKLAA